MNRYTMELWKKRACAQRKKMGVRHYNGLSERICKKLLTKSQEQLHFSSPEELIINNC